MWGDTPHGPPRMGCTPATPALGGDAEGLGNLGPRRPPQPFVVSLSNHASPVRDSKRQGGGDSGRSASFDELRTNGIERRKPVSRSKVAQLVPPGGALKPNVLS